LPLSPADITLGKHERAPYLLFDLLTTLAKLLRPGGSRTVIAENLLLKQQLIIHRRSRQRAPNLTNWTVPYSAFFHIFEYQAYRQISNSHQAIYPAFIS